MSGPKVIDLAKHREARDVRVRELVQELAAVTGELGTLAMEELEAALEGEGSEGEGEGLGDGGGSVPTGGGPT